MVGLRPWQRRLFLAEVAAAIVVISGAHLLSTAQAARFPEGFAAGVTGAALLWPGLWLLRPGPTDSLAAACLLAAAIYTILLFGLMTLVAKAAQSRRKRFVAADQTDLNRYLR